MRWWRRLRRAWSGADDLDAYLDLLDAREAEDRAALDAGPVVRLRRHGRLVPPADADSRLSVDIGPRQEAIAIWVTAADRAALTSSSVVSGWARFPDSQAEQPVAAVVTTHAPALTATQRLPELSLAFPFVQPMPDGGVLVVGARCVWTSEGPEVNGIVYDAEGRVRQAATVGDGIAHVQVTDTGDVWIGYFDEGIFGNYGWGGPGPSPLGASGLVRLDPDLAPAWRYPSATEHGSIDDCYALNVGPDGVWACYYTDFPIVRIHDDQVQGWRNDVGGAHALISDGATAALIGGYGSLHDRLVLGTLDATTFEILGTLRLALGDGDPLPPEAHIVGRGALVHAFIGDAWYVASLDDAKAAAVPSTP